MTEPVLSIVVPVLNEAKALPALVHSLAPLRARGAELIVVDGGSDDGSRELAATLADQWLPSSRGRAVQMNAGAAVAKGRFLLFLHADTQLPADREQWLDSLEAQEHDWGFFPVRLDGAHFLLRWVERGMNWRSRLSSVATGDQGLWLRRETFQYLGGFPAIALMEDVAMSKRLRSHVRPAIWPTPLTTSSRRWEQKGILRTILLMWWLRLQFVCGVSPDALVRRYEGGRAGGH